VLRERVLPGRTWLTGTDEFLFGSKSVCISVVDVQIREAVASLALMYVWLEFSIVQYSAMPMALVMRRMNSWFSDGIRAFASAPVRESAGWFAVLIDTRG
jgi:hypothetical protein